MKVYNKIIPLLILLFMSCSNVKSIYEKDSGITKNDSFSNLLISQLKLEEKKSIIYFTGTFNDNNVKVNNNKKIILNRKLKSIEQLGVAGSCIVENDSDVSIIIDNNKNVTLNTDNLKLYKFIYLEKQSKKYIITFTNKARSFR